MTPRRAAVVIATTLISTFLLSDADAVRKRWDVGVHGGANIAGIYGVDEDSLGSNNRNGFAIGIYGTKWIGENLGVRLEAMYSQKGATRRDPGEPEVTAKLDYIDIPLTVLFSRELSRRKFYGHFYVGPTLSFRVHAEYDDTTGTAENLDDITESYDFSGALGVAFALRAIERLDVTLDLRYTVGFVSIDNTGNDLDLRNNAFSVLLGVETRLGYW